MEHWRDMGSKFLKTMKLHHYVVKTFFVLSLQNKFTEHIYYHKNTCNTTQTVYEKKK